MRKNHKATARFDRFSVAVWTIWLVPYMCRMLMGIPIINLSVNAAFGVALIGADMISLALYLRGMHGGGSTSTPLTVSSLASPLHNRLNPADGHCRHARAQMRH